MNYRITPATWVDVPNLNILVNSAYRGSISKKGWTTEADLIDGTRVDESVLNELIQRSDTTILMYHEDEKLLSCVELRKENTKLYLGMLSVAPDTQGKGIGKKMLTAAEVFAKESNLHTIFMSVISVRKELIDWYIRHGYLLTGERKPFIVPDERWGIPKTSLEFLMLEKVL
jgi:ribosomal protein S18 acetylase RimI-like enzyme